MQIMSITRRKQSYSILKSSMNISSTAHSQISSCKQLAALPEKTWCTEGISAWYGTVVFKDEHIGEAAFLRCAWLQSGQQAGLLIKGGGGVGAACSVILQKPLNSKTQEIKVLKETQEGRFSCRLTWNWMLSLR